MSWQSDFYSMVSALLAKHCGGYAKGYQCQNQHYTTIFSDDEYSGVKFQHMIVNAITINLPKEMILLHMVNKLLTKCCRGHTECYQHWN